MNRASVRRPVRPGVLIIPVSAGFLVPLLLWLPLGSWPVSSPSSAVSVARYLIGAPLALLGIWMVADSVNRVYIRQGTPLGDKPPDRLVIAGWYGLVRNPMTIGMITLIVAEALLAMSVPILLWAGIVFAVSCATTLKIEEPSLADKFGEKYQTYMHRTRRWIPSFVRPKSDPGGGSWHSSI